MNRPIPAFLTKALLVPALLSAGPQPMPTALWSMTQAGLL